MLLEQTTVIVASEIGRFPRLNASVGKDHWPENSWLLFGKGIRPGITLGGTDRQLRGIPFDFRSGDPASSERRPVFVESLFATLLRVAGGEPSRAGYAKDAVISALVG